MARVDELCELCKQERKKYQKDSNPLSPACIELFHLAFSGDQAAWFAIHEIFDKLIRSWVGVQQDIEQDDALQLVYLDFSRSAPKRPDLVKTDNLAPLLKFLKMSAKTAVLQLRRAQKGYQWFTSLDTLMAATDQASDYEVTQNQHDRQRLRETLENSQRWTDEIELQLIIQQRLNELLPNVLEKQVFDLFYRLHIPQKEIVKILSSADVSDDKAVAQIIQRIKRRMKQDPTLQSLATARQNSTDAALLTMVMLDEMEKNAKDQTVDTSCEYDEATLLEYLMGIATADVSRAINTSPACQLIVRNLLYDLGPLLKILYRQLCPNVEKLVAYQNKELIGTEQLVVHQHLRYCPHCRDELQILTEMDKVSLTVEPSLFRRVIEAFFQSLTSLPQPARGGEGDWQTRETPQVLIQLKARRNLGKEYNWSLRGKVYDQSRNLIHDQVEQVILQPLDISEAEEIIATIQPGESSFVFKRLVGGAYRLSVITHGEEIVIRRLVIGEEE